MGQDSPHPLEKHRTLYRVLLTAWFAGVVWGSLVSAKEMSSLELVAPFLHADKLVHYGAYAGLALLCLLAFERRRGVAVALSMILLGIVLELAQHFSPGRTPDVKDAIANSLGVFSGIVLGLLVTGALARSRQAETAPRRAT